MARSPGPQAQDQQLTLVAAEPRRKIHRAPSRTKGRSTNSRWPMYLPPVDRPVGPHNRSRSRSWVRRANRRPGATSPPNNRRVIRSATTTRSSSNCSSSTHSTRTTRARRTKITTAATTTKINQFRSWITCCSRRLPSGARLKNSTARCLHSEKVGS